MATFRIPRNITRRYWYNEPNHLAVFLYLFIHSTANKANNTRIANVSVRDIAEWTKLKVNDVNNVIASMETYTSTYSNKKNTVQDSDLYDYTITLNVGAAWPYIEINTTVINNLRNKCFNARNFVNVLSVWFTLRVKAALKDLVYRGYNVQKGAVIVTMTEMETATGLTKRQIQRTIQTIKDADLLRNETRFRERTDADGNLVREEVNDMLCTQFVLLDYATKDEKRKQSATGETRHGVTKVPAVKPSAVKEKVSKVKDVVSVNNNKSNVETDVLYGAILKACQSCGKITNPKKIAKSHELQVRAYIKDKNIVLSDEQIASIIEHNMSVWKNGVYAIEDPLHPNTENVITKVIEKYLNNQKEKASKRQEQQLARIESLATTTFQFMFMAYNFKGCSSDTSFARVRNINIHYEKLCELYPELRNVLDKEQAIDETHHKLGSRMIAADYFTWHYSKLNNLHRDVFRALVIKQLSEKVFNEIMGHTFQEEKQMA